MYTHIYIGLPIINGWGEKKLGAGGLGWRSGRTGSLAWRAALAARARGAAQGCARWVGGVASWVRGYGGLAGRAGALSGARGADSLAWRATLSARARRGPGLAALSHLRASLVLRAGRACGQAAQRFPRPAKPKPARPKRAQPCPPGRPGRQASHPAPSLSNPSRLLQVGQQKYG